MEGDDWKARVALAQEFRATAIMGAAIVRLMGGEAGARANEKAFEGMRELLRFCCVRPLPEVVLEYASSYMPDALARLGPQPPCGPKPPHGSGSSVAMSWMDRNDAYLRWGEAVMAMVDVDAAMVLSITSPADGVGLAGR